MNKEQEIAYAAAKVVHKCQEIAKKHGITEEEAYKMMLEQNEISEDYGDFLINQKNTGELN